jgi:hypothetical protein
MENKCIVLDIAHSYKGESVILDFPPETTPYIGMELKDNSGNQWKIAGMGLPVILDVLVNKIATYYDSKMVWDCLLQAMNHEATLEKGAGLSW